MANFKTVFIIGFIGGLVGYACGAMFTPTNAIAQQITPADAGVATGDAPMPVSDGGGIAPAASAVPTPSCRQWEVRIDQQYLSGPATFTIEEGWEPFAYNSSFYAVVLRRCVR